MMQAAAPSPGTRMTDEASLAWLTQEITALSDLAVMWSRSAYTARRTFHIAFANGFILSEGQELPLAVRYVPKDDPQAMAEAVLAGVLDYRSSIKGPVGLVWRCEPEFRDDMTYIYTRLCFEPAPGAR